MDPSARVALAEIRGDVRLILASLDRQTTDLQAIRRTLEKHDARIESLETTRTENASRTAGVTATIKTIWVAAGAVVTAMAVAVLKKLGLV